MSRPFADRWSDDYKQGERDYDRHGHPDYGRSEYAQRDDNYFGGYEHSKEKDERRREERREEEKQEEEYEQRRIKERRRQEESEQEQQEQQELEPPLGNNAEPLKRSN